MRSHATIPPSSKHTPLPGSGDSGAETTELDGVARVAAKLLTAKAVWIGISQGSELRVAGRSDEPGGEPEPLQLLSELLESHKSTRKAVVTQTEIDIASDSAPQVGGGLQSMSAVSLVLRSPGGRTIGCIAAFDLAPREWTDTDLDDLEELGDLAATAFEKNRRADDAEWLEDAVQVQAAYLDHLFDQAPEAISLVDSDMRVVRVNPEYTRMLGYTPDEVVGRTPEEMGLPPEELEQALSIIGRALTGEQVRAEVHRRCKDGTHIRVAVLSVPVRISRERIGAYVICRDLTKELDVRAAIERNEQRFRALIENAMELVAVLGTGGVIDYVTPSVERILGQTPATLIGTNVFGMIHPDDAPEAIARFTGLLRRPCEKAMELRMRAAGDGWRTLEVRATNMMDDPEVAGVVINARDITDERYAKQMQRQLNAFLEATPDFVATFDPHGRALSVNRAFRDLIGVDDTGVRDLTLTDLFPPAVTEKLLQEGIPRANKEGAWSGETVVQSMDGEVIPISQVVLSHKSAGGSLEFISTLARDITAQKEAEAALRHSEAHFRSLIEHSSDVISITDLEGRLTFVTPSIRRVLGYEPADLLGTSIFSLVHEEEIGFVGESFTRIVQEKDVPPPAEFRVRHKDGSYRRLEAVSQNLMSNPAVRGVVINCRDVTERRIAEEALTESQQQLIQAQKMEAIGRLAGGIAHDFNNLLTAIKGFTELLLLDFEENDPRRGFATEIQGAATRAAGLTRQLLAFSRRQVLQPEVLDLNRSVREMEKMLQRLIGEDMHMKCTLGSKLGRVKADPGQVEQVVMNLVVNARDALPNGGEVRIRTSNAELTEGDEQAFRYVQPGPYVLLEVSDNGEGMTKEVQERIFEPFFTTKEQGKGTGLGLSTVYGIIKQSGGYIWVDSEPDQGTTFRIYLPRVDEEVTTRTGEKSEAGGSLEGTETVLLVEDEVAVRTLVRRVLERSGYKIAEASTGTQALALIEAGHLEPELLLTDVIMPGISGRELADELCPKLPDMKVLYMSGYTDESIVHHGVLDEGVAFIEKPFTPDALLRRVREVLDAVVK